MISLFLCLFFSSLSCSNCSEVWHSVTVTVFSTEILSLRTFLSIRYTTSFISLLFFDFFLGFLCWQFKAKREKLPAEEANHNRCQFILYIFFQRVLEQQVHVVLDLLDFWLKNHYLVIINMKPTYKTTLIMNIHVLLSWYTKIPITFNEL